MNHKLDTDGQVFYYEHEHGMGADAENEGLRIIGSPGMAQGTVLAAFDVLKERRRQTQEEGWTPAHDDAHTDGALAKAASCYSLCAGIGLAHIAGGEGHYEFVDDYSTADCPNPVWPFDEEWWKPKNPRRDLVRAAALILAEIERIDRAVGKTQAADANPGD